MKTKDKRVTVKRINLALQGGGAHGAFTWGVLDRLLEEERLEIAAISGTSAGALNGAALKAGMISGGRDGARENLDWLWHQVAKVQDLRMPAWMNASLPDPAFVSQSLTYSLPFQLADAWSRTVSPYALGPLYSNPLGPIVERFDYGRVCAKTGPALHICATNVRSGKVRVFSGDDISPEAVMASACLPTLFQAVEVTDPGTGQVEAYWDGGYTGNPALFPLYAADLPRDILVVNINPLVRDKVPVSPAEIQNRINEISFNSSLLRELRAVSFVQRLLAEGTMSEGAMKDVLVHMIADDDLMNDLSVATKTVPLASVISQLRDAGRRGASAFLERHWDDLNNRQSADLADMFS